MNQEFIDTVVTNMVLRNEFRSFAPRSFNIETIRNAVNEGKIDLSKSIELCKGKPEKEHFSACYRELCNEIKKFVKTLPIIQ